MLKATPGKTRPGLAIPGLADLSARAGSAPSELPLDRIGPPYSEFERVRDPSNLEWATRVPGTLLAVTSTRPGSDWQTLQAILPRLRARYPAAPVVLRLPRGEVPDIVHLAARAGSLHIRAVLVEGEPIAPALRTTLTNPPDLAGDITEWLTVRGLTLPPRLRSSIHEIVRHAPEHGKIGGLLRGIGESERTVRSWFSQGGLAAPSHWLAAARALHAALRLQREVNRSLLTVALDAGYSDASHLTRQIARLFDTTPATIRLSLGWEWLLDRWLRSEWALT